MATFKLEIDCDNAAFGDGDMDECRREVQRILAAASRSFGDTGNDSGRLRDINGNRVGSFEYTP
jgi:hypothetical protein